MFIVAMECREELVELLFENPHIVALLGSDVGEALMGNIQHLRHIRRASRLLFVTYQHYIRAMLF